MGVSVMRWDKITVVYGVLFYGHKWVQFEAQGPAGPEGIKLKPRVPIEMYSSTLPYYYPTVLLSPEYSIKFFHTTSQFPNCIYYFMSPTVFCYQKLYINKLI